MIITLLIIASVVTCAALAYSVFAYRFGFRNGYDEGVAAGLRCAENMPV